MSFCSCLSQSAPFFDVDELRSVPVSVGVECDKGDEALFLPSFLLSRFTVLLEIQDPVVAVAEESPSNISTSSSLPSASNEDDTVIFLAVVFFGLAFRISSSSSLWYFVDMGGEDCRDLDDEDDEDGDWRRCRDGDGFPALS